MSAMPPSNALCIGCNYSLRELVAIRCPECGRPFDPLDSRTYNTRRPLRALDHLLLKPIGVPTFFIVLMLCAAILWLALSPSIYYMFAYVVLLIFLWLLASAYLVLRRWLQIVRVSHISHDPGRRRTRAIVAILITTSVLVLFHIPLHIELMLVRPALEKWVREIENGTAPPPPDARRIGLFQVSRSNWYGNDHVVFFRFESNGLGGGGGFVYHTGNDALGQYYNTGTDGHLTGNWHWWIDD